jgi:hypothetical protein
MTLSGVAIGEQAAVHPDPDSREISSTSVLDVSGKWKSSAGLSYEIMQYGDEFIWEIGLIDAPGAGIIQGKNLAVSWSGPRPGSATGIVTRVDANGRAIRIVWDNRVTFEREGIPIDISGRWKSTLGPVYQITQKGDKFSWEVENIYAPGTGAINGRRVKASWLGPSPGLGNGRLTEVDAAGRATRIAWDSGVIFEKVD